MPRRFSRSVRNSELVSVRFGVSSSEPTAMISASGILASAARFSDQRPAGDAGVHAKERVRSGQNHRARGREGQAHDGRTGEEQLRIGFVIEAYHPAPAAQRRGYIQTIVGVEG